MDFEEVLLECETRMEEAIEVLDKRFINVRAGRANPSMLDGVMVEYYAFLRRKKNEKETFSSLTQHSYGTFISSMRRW